MAQCTPKSFDLTGKVALITGASYGIGMAIAKAMAANGATIVFNDIKQELVDKGLASYAEAGIKAHGYVCDVTDEDAVNAMVAKITEEVGHINILVNNAGIIKRCDAIDVTPENWDAVDFLNEKMVFFLSQAVAKQWVADKKGGKIINIASMLSFQGGIRVPAYTSSKSAVMGMTKALANEWAKYGINVNAIAPGYMATNNTNQLRQDEDRSEEILARIPAGRWGTPEDMVGPCVFLASHASDFVNGQILYADGGILAYIGKQPK